MIKSSNFTVEERTESLEYGDGTETCVLSKTQLHEHEREPDQQQHAHERDQERACTKSKRERDPDKGLECLTDKTCTKRKHNLCCN